MERPRRSARQPIKAPTLVASEPSRPVKRRPTPEVDPEKTFKTLLESSKSDLASLDMHVCVSAGERPSFVLFLVWSTSLVSCRELNGSLH